MAPANLIKNTRKVNVRFNASCPPLHVRNLTILAGAHATSAKNQSSRVSSLRVNWHRSFLFIFFKKNSGTRDASSQKKKGGRKEMGRVGLVESGAGLKSTLRKADRSIAVEGEKIQLGGAKWPIELLSDQHHHHQNLCRALHRKLVVCTTSLPGRT